MQFLTASPPPSRSDDDASDASSTLGHEADVADVEAAGVTMPSLSDLRQQSADAGSPYLEPEAYPDTDAAYPNTDAAYPNTDDAYPNTDDAYPNTDGAYPDTNAAYPDSEAAYPNTDAAYPNTDDAYPNTDEAYPDTDAQYGAALPPDAAGGYGAALPPAAGYEPLPEPEEYGAPVGPSQGSSRGDEDLFSPTCSALLLCPTLPHCTVVA